MDIKSLLDLTCAKVASMIKGLFLLKRFLSRRQYLHKNVLSSRIGKTPEQIRKKFNIQNDFTPEEEEAVRAENKWAEES